MAITTAGVTQMLQAALGETPTFFTNSTSYIGVGDSTTAFSAAQTDLVAATNRLKKVMDATFPSRASLVVTFQATFATGDANFAWQEWGVFNGGPAFATGTMISRKVESLGTKTSAQSWQFTVQLTFAAA